MTDTLPDSRHPFLHRILTAALFCVAVVAGACGTAGVAMAQSARAADYAGREVGAVRFAGDLQIPEDSLRAVTVTRPTRCQLLFLPFCIPGTGIGRNEYRLDLTELTRDVARIQLYHRDHGFYGTRVVPTIDPMDRDRVEVRFAIVPGDRVILRELVIDGTEEIIPPEDLLRQIPLRADEPFRRSAFLASADTIRAQLLRRGYAYAEVLRNYGIDTVADFAEVQYVAIPGPLVRVDSVVVAGANRLGPGTVRRQLTFREDDILRITDLNRSQRNLYGLGMVNFATVEIAPDTLQLIPQDSTRGTVLVRVVEAPQYLVDANVGYGTVDCLRTGTRWTNRNFIGGARRLEVSGSISRVGVGWPAAWGMENGLCTALQEDEFSDTINYQVGADFQQPRIFGTENQLGVGVRAQRLSELGAFMRQAVGGQVAVSRDLGRYTLLTTTADVEWGVTRANPANLCLAVDICEPELQRFLQRPRWSNALTFNTVHDRTVTDGFVVGGFALRGGVGWASPLLGSDDDYLRLSGEATTSRVVSPGWVLAGRLYGGTFLRGTLDPRAEFIPPERRFYAGGPNTVRGFPRNALGPIVYVNRQPTAEFPQGPAASATGGTQLGVGSVELRGPSPVLSQFMRLGYFVDAGQVWAPEADVTAPIRFTPGLGLRFITPVGPIRVDAAYNPYGREAGRLYVIDPGTGNLILQPGLFQPERGGFWNRFQIHFAVGQAF